MSDDIDGTNEGWWSWRGVGYFIFYFKWLK